MHELGGCCLGGCGSCSVSIMALANCSPPAMPPLSAVGSHQCSECSQNPMCFQLFELILYLKVTCRPCCCASCEVATGSLVMMRPTGSQNTILYTFYTATLLT